MNCGPQKCTEIVGFQGWLWGANPRGCSSLMSLTPLTGDSFVSLPEILFAFTLLDSVHLFMHFSPARPPILLRYN